MGTAIVNESIPLCKERPLELRCFGVVHRIGQKIDVYFACLDGWHANKELPDQVGHVMKNQRTLPAGVGALTGTLS